MTVLERANARALDPAELPYAPDLIVLDVSFISLRKVLPAVLACAAPRFDASRWSSRSSRSAARGVGKGGVVREPEARRAARRPPSPTARARSAPPCSASPPPGCPGRRATSRRSSGWPRAAATGALDDVGAARAEVEA